MSLSIGQQKIVHVILRQITLSTCGKCMLAALCKSMTGMGSQPHTKKLSLCRSAPGHSCRWLESFASDRSDKATTNKGLFPTTAPPRPQKQKNRQGHESHLLLGMRFGALGWGHRKNRKACAKLCLEVSLHLVM